MRTLREKIAWIIAGTLALGVAAAVATAVSGGSLDPPGPPSDTGPLQAVMLPPEGRLIQVADDVLVPKEAVTLPAGTATATGIPNTNTPTSTPTAPIGRILPVSLRIERPQDSAPDQRLGSTQISLRLDCDTATAGVQSSCVFASGTNSAAVDVILENTSGTDFQLAAYDFVVLASPAFTFAPIVPGSCSPPATSCNPDHLVAGASWTCTPPNPSPDLNSDGDFGTTQSFISCFNNADGPNVVNGGAGIALARVNFAVNGDGVGSFNVASGSVYDILGAEYGSCGGTANCVGATIQVGASAATPTATITPTPSITPLPSDTPCSGPPCPTRTSLAFATITPTPQAPSGAISLGNVDVDDCAELVVFVEAASELGQSGASLLQIQLQLSATNDGAFGPLRFEGNSSAWTIPVQSGAATESQRGTMFGQGGQDAPFVGVLASVAPGAEVDVRLDAWLYCIPRT